MVKKSKFSNLHSSMRKVLIVPFQILVQNKRISVAEVHPMDNIGKDQSDSHNSFSMQLNQPVKTAFQEKETW